MSGCYVVVPSIKERCFKKFEIWGVEIVVLSVTVYLAIVALHKLSRRAIAYYFLLLLLFVQSFHGEC